MEKIPMRMKYLKPILMASAFIGISQLSAVSFAQNADATKLYNRSLAATCANCHGTDGKGVPEGGMPLINNLSSQEMLKKLMDYKSGALEGTIMPQLAKGYTDEQLKTIANQLGKKQ
jgi:sulfide dehydrogenase cytochrome subunit